MALPVNQQVLEAIQAALQAASLVQRGRVHLDRTDEISETELPAIDILGGDTAAEESLEYLTMHDPALQLRSYSFELASVTGALDGAAKTGRVLAGQVEAVLCASVGVVTVNGRGIPLRLVQSVESKVNSNAKPFFAVRQTWQAEYQTAANDPTQAI